MKYFISCLLICWCFCVSAQKENGVRNVLFIGNSYTSAHNLPSMLNEIALSAGDTVFCDSHTPGASRFQDHVYNNSMKIIKQGGWDCVILQEQSQLPAFPIEDVEIQCFPFARMLADSVRAYSECSRVMFYMTWGRKNGDLENCHYHPPVCTYEGMDSLLQARYLIMGEDNNADVSPVGAVWRYLRTNHPKIELYESDESHPKINGTYAAACTFYVMLFQKSASGINDDISIDAETKQAIKNAVDSVVFDNLSHWIKLIDVIADFTFEKIDVSTIQFENSSTNADAYHWDFGDGLFSDEENPTHHYTENGNYQVKLIASNGCNFDSIIYFVEIDDWHGINTQTYSENNAIKCYPNPVRDVLVLETSSPEFSGEYTIEVYDKVGRLIWTDKRKIAGNSLINTDFMKKGVYFIKLISDDKIVFKDKIVK